MFIRVELIALLIKTFHARSIWTPSVLQKFFCQYQFARLGQELGNYVDNKILGQRTAGVQSR
jgi:hypothetical protein